MLGSIARKLRIFGFDTQYAAHVDDSEVLKIGIDQGRVILTADKELFKRVVKANAAGVLVDGVSELDDLVYILQKSGVRYLDEAAIGSRCSVCNGPLVSASARDAQEKLPEKVVMTHNEFSKCASCGKMFWEGSHIEHMRVLAKNIDSRLGKTN
jgi:uncharacterized protein with PIN domain